MNEQRNIKWRQDIEQLGRELPEGHRNLFFHRNEQEFYRDIEELKSNIQYFDDYELYAQIGKIVAAIKDAHTSAFFNVRRFLPFELYWFSKGIYVVSAIEKYKKILNCKITHINGITMEEIIDIVKTIVSYENESYLKAQLPKYIPAIELLYGLEIVDDIDKVNMAFEDIDGNEIELCIESENLKDFRKNFINSRNDDLSKELLPLYMRNPHKYYWYEYLEEFKTLYFKYNACREIVEEPINKVCNEMLYLLESKGIDKFVIDLRDNFGGNSTLLDSFIKALSKCEHINRKGRLFVIVGRETFSSALLNAYSLKNKTEAIFIGEPTGGKPNCYGEVERFILKNSGIVITYSTKYYELIEDDNILSFVPDINLEIDICNYIENQDPYLEYILNKSI